MVKDISILSVGVGMFDIGSSDAEVEEVETLEAAISTIKSKFYDAIVINSDLPDGEGATITNFYPHYRTIIYVEAGTNEKDLNKFRNGFYAIIETLDNIKKYVNGIIFKYPKKEQDTLIALMTIQGSIELLSSSQEFITNSFSSIHNKLKSLEESQQKFNEGFQAFKDQRTKNEQFFIDTVVNLKEDIDGIRRKNKGV